MQTVRPKLVFYYFYEMCSTNLHLNYLQEDAPINIGSVSQYLKDKKITPSNLKFGFLGLGIMGRGIVKNLLNSGHKVIVWNRSPEKVSNKYKACFGMSNLCIVGAFESLFTLIVTVM